MAALASGAGAKASGSFLKKRTKKLLPLVPRTGDASCAERLGERAKVFGSFFKKNRFAAP
jgi:hypothetical protein